jgi:hypothetical protein
VEWLLAGKEELLQKTWKRLRSAQIDKDHREMYLISYAFSLFQVSLLGYWKEYCIAGHSVITNSVFCQVKKGKAAQRDHCIVFAQTTVQK